MWNWVWIGQYAGNEVSIEEDCSDEVPEPSDEEPEPSDEEQSNSDTVPGITHSVVFKCIGHMKEKRYQEVIAFIRVKRYQ